MTTPGDILKRVWTKDIPFCHIEKRDPARLDILEAVCHRDLMIASYPTSAFCGMTTAPPKKKAGISK